MKALFQSIGLALVLFLYGYFLSVAGHDHSAHEGKEKSHEPVSHELQTGDAHEHNDGHSH